MKIQHVVLTTLFPWDEQIVIVSALKAYLDHMRRAVGRLDDEFLKELMQTDIATAERLIPKLTDAFAPAPPQEEEDE